MGNALFAISAYIFMRAFEVLFAGQKGKAWYKGVIGVVAVAVMYAAAATMIWFYRNDLHLLGFDPK
jgi:hypothetical protein